VRYRAEYFLVLMAVLLTMMIVLWLIGEPQPLP